MSVAPAVSECPKCDNQLDTQTDLRGPHSPSHELGDFSISGQRLTMELGQTTALITF